MTPLSTQIIKLQGAHGQSLWCEYISREMLDSGDLERLIREDGIKGVISNPSIFAQALADSDVYTVALQAAEVGSKLTTKGAYEELVLADIRNAADCLRTVYERTDHRDGYACLEVSPHLVDDSEKTIREARRLWQALDRPNVMIKVPATRAGLVAIATLLTEGINVNITLLFSLPVYRQVADTYVRALEQRSANGDDPAKVASVASFYVSRIDTVFDKLVNSLVARGVFQDVYMDLSSIRGQVATATAKIAYQYYKEIFSGVRWDALAAKGAGTQRLLWASMGVKAPAYSDLRYVEELLGPDTVNMLSPETLQTFREHGVAGSRLEQDVAAAHEILETVRLLGLPLDTITDKLLSDGVDLCTEVYDKLLDLVAQQRHDLAGKAPRQTTSGAVASKP